MNKIFLALGLIALASASGTTASAQVIMDLVKVTPETIISGYDYPDDKRVEFYYENKDYCNYYLIRENDDSYILRPGKNVIQRFDRTTPSATLKQAGRYIPLKGVPVNDLNPAFPYALPVKAGTQVKLLPDKREKVRSYVVLMKPGDPVCAMRGGKVCKNEKDGTVLVSHKDGTFAAYANLDEVSVTEGDGLLPGDEIGICGDNRLTISVFMLDANKIEGKKYPYTHMTPYFRTSGGDSKLKVDTLYTAAIDPELISMDMGKAAKKKYLKQASKK